MTPEATKALADIITILTALPRPTYRDSPMGGTVVK